MGKKTSKSLLSHSKQINAQAEFNAWWDNLMTESGMNPKQQETIKQQSAEFTRRSQELDMLVKMKCLQDIEEGETIEDYKKRTISLLETHAYMIQHVL